MTGPDADAVRRSLYAWAAQRGILTDAAQREAMTLGGSASGVPFTDDHADFFRTRRIMRIRTEDFLDGPTVVIATRQAIAAKKAAELKKVFKEHYDGLSLSVTTAASYKIDQSVKTLGPTVRWRSKRVTCGSSVGIGNQRNAGTLTALVKRPDSDQLLGLSCNHVLGGCNTTVPGTPIVVPGIQDVTAETEAIDVVGTFSEAASMRQGLPTVTDISDNADLACFELNARGAKLLTSWQGVDERSYDTPVDFATPEPGQRLSVQKWGRSTGHTTGSLSVLTEAEPVEYALTSYFGPQASQAFKGTIYFPHVYEVSSTGRPFSEGGDSGSLVVTNEGDETPPRVVGVIIAGGTAKTLVLPLEPMLAQLGLELVTDYPPAK